MGEFALDVLAQFGGGRGEAGNDLVRFGLGAVLWGVLTVIARRRKLREGHLRERLLLWGFGLGLTRECVMLGLTALGMTGLVGPALLGMVTPPLGHALSQVSVVVVIAAFLLYLTGDGETVENYLSAGLSFSIVAYLASSLWWVPHFDGHTGALFEGTWAAWLFPVPTALLIAVAVAYIRRRSVDLREAFLATLWLLLVEQFLMILNISAGGRLGHVTAPVQNVIHLAAIALLGYVYYQKRALQRSRVEESIKKSEHKFQSLFESAAVGIMIYDMEGVISDLNATAHDQMGYDREELLATPVSGLDHADTVIAAKDRLRQIRAEGHGHYESVYRRKNGSGMPVEVNSRVVELDNREAVLSVFKDITERKEAEQKLLQAKDRIIDEMTRHREYIFEVADRLRNPLQKMKGYLELLETDSMTEAQQDMVSLIRKSEQEIEERIKILT